VTADEKFNKIFTGIQLILEEMREDRRQAAGDRRQAAEDRRRSDDRFEHLVREGREHMDAIRRDGARRERQTQRILVRIEREGRAIRRSLDEHTVLLRHIARRMDAGTNGRNGNGSHRRR